MRKYKQLTEEHRIEIYAMKQAGNLQKEIAKKLGVHPSTICRELRRNLGGRGYRPKQAHSLALQRRTTSRKFLKMTPATMAYIATKLKLQHSPEQIAARMKFAPDWHGPTVSHERIYQYIWHDKAAGGTLYQHLRIAGSKQRRKRRNRRDSRGKIPNRIGIAQRPPIVAKKTRIGDWEGDTIVGARHRGALVSLVERKSKLTLLAKVDNYSAPLVEHAIVRLLQPIYHRVHTLTVDNGKEFATHEALAFSLNTRVFFADPYCSWQRGLNENTNGLIRQYVPKGTDIRKLSDEDVLLIMNRLNNRPRKTLGFSTPNEVFYKRKYSSY
jgi:IS30 family transposase